MISPDDPLLPEIKLVDTYIGTLEHLIYSLGENCNLLIFPPALRTQIIMVQEEIRKLRSAYVESIKFQF